MENLVIGVLSITLLFILIGSQSSLLCCNICSIMKIIKNGVFGTFQLEGCVGFRLLRLGRLRPVQRLVPTLQVFLLGIITDVCLRLSAIVLKFLGKGRTMNCCANTVGLAGVLVNVASSLYIILLPHLSGLIIRGRHRRFRQLLEGTLSCIVAVTTPVDVKLIVVTPALICLFYNRKCMPSVSAVRVATPVVLFVDVSCILMRSVFSLNGRGVAVVANVINTLAGITVGFVLVPR